ncbi:MAG: proline dehydrogenase family protein [Kordiimonadaceae bacterium]|nr:proline dehydrogenase family protein [Kordiimonadaceae bacterium]
MFRRIWQTILVAMATSGWWQKRMQSSRKASELAKRYVRGSNTEEAGLVAAQLAAEGITSSLFYLGEYVDTEELVAENMAAKLTIVKTLAGKQLEIHVSLDPTQLGSALSWVKGAENVARVAQDITALAKGGDRDCAMLDMEDYSVNLATIELHDNLKQQKLRVGLTLQAYLKKTYADMEKKIAEGAMVRLVKGAFPAGSDVAYQSTADIKANYVRLIDLMLSKKARKTGFYPVFATHDHKLHAYAIEVALANGWLQGSYEFEMLYGARDNVARQLAAAGESIRLYLPFGSDWWPYAVRRIGENPRGAMLLLRSLFKD